MRKDYEQMGSSFDGGRAAFTAFQETYNHWLNVVLCSKYMSNNVRLTTGCDISRKLLAYGEKLSAAYRESNGYRRYKLTCEASELYDSVKFAIQSILVTPYLGSSKFRPAWRQKANPLARYREHTMRLVDRGGRILGGWLRWCKANQGSR